MYKVNKVAPTYSKFNFCLIIKPVQKKTFALSGEASQISVF